MDILGIGGWELVALLILMLVVAGPKRMIEWSYVVGREIAKLRRMWGETAKILQKELDSAGIEYKVPEAPPTRGELRNEALKMIAPITKPMQDAMQEVEQDVGEVKKTASQVNNLKLSTQNPTPAPKPATKPVTPNPPRIASTPAGAAASANGKKTTSPPSTNGAGNFGSWSGNAANPATPADASNANAESDKPTFGAWSSGGTNDTPSP